MNDLEKVFERERKIVAEQMGVKQIKKVLDESPGKVKGKKNKKNK